MYKKKKLNILCTICARSGSSSVKNKALKYIKGKPLIYYSINKAIRSNLYDEVVVSTDSKKIQKVSKKFGAKCWFLRKKQLSTKFSPKKLTLIDLLRNSEKKFKKNFDIIVDLDLSSPLRNINDLKNSLKKFIKNKNDLLISVNECRKNPYYNMVEIKKNLISIVKNNKKNFYSRQQAPKVYEMNSSIHIRRRSVLMDKKNLKMKFTRKSSIFIMPKNRSIDVDTEYEFNLIKKVL